MDNVNQAVETILCNKVILLQTDTVFGLVCKGDSLIATNSVEKIKNRDHPAFGYFFKNLNMAQQYVKINNELQEQIFNKVFPGYFTLIFEATDFALGTLPPQAFGKNKQNHKTLGIRIPNNDFCLRLLNDKRITFPLLATSANISKQKTPIVFEDIDKEILKQVDGVFYDQNIKMAKKSSTIIDLSDGKNIVVLRDGSGIINF